MDFVLWKNGLWKWILEVKKWTLEMDFGLWTTGLWKWSLDFGQMDSLLSSHGFKIFASLFNFVFNREERLEMIIGCLE